MNKKRRDNFKRDNNIIKYVLEEIEKVQVTNEGFTMTFKEDEDYSVEALDYHLALLFNAGFVDGGIWPKGDDIRINRVTSISWDGHDLLDALRNDKAMKLAEQEAK